MTGPNDTPETRELPPLGQGPGGEILVYPPDQVPEEDVVVVGPNGIVSIDEEDEAGGFEDGADL